MRNPDKTNGTIVAWCLLFMYAGYRTRTCAQAFERGGAERARAHLQLCSSNSGARYLHAHANEAP